jgi:hypothetical protein
LLAIWPPRASASCCWSAATGCRASWRTGMPKPSSSRTAISHPIPGTITQANPSSRRCTTSSAARPSSTGRPSTACARKISANCAMRVVFRLPGPSAMRKWNPTTARPSSCIRCMARAGKTPPSRRAARLTPTRRSPMSRASSNSQTIWPKQATILFTPPAASCSTNKIGRSVSAFAAPRAMASRAWCMPNPMPRCWACARRWSMPTSLC